ncbi:MAG TPA: hypothetical protein VHW26_09475 [Solirubrobacteraceae bacterium]|jgi:hypothetical protein|nr:hypothetical protein [Solirubrobacteraceae bacterium]
MSSTLRLIPLLAVAVAVASCGGPPAARVAPASDAPGIAGLSRAIQDAQGAVAASQRDAARASATSAGP